MPSISMACENHIKEKEGIEISHTTVEPRKSCCSSGQGSEKDDKSCSSNCEHSCCPCATTSSSSAFNLISDAIYSSNNSTYFLYEKSQFTYISGMISEGFLSIWLIPKIG